MAETWVLIAGLALGTFALRLGGFLLGTRLPSSGPWMRAFTALPGSLIAALIAILLLQGGPAEWLAAAAALLVAVVSRNLPLTMLVGIATVWLARLVL